MSIGLCRRASPLATIVYAVDGSVLAHWYAGEDRTLVVSEDLSESLIDAVVAATTIFVLGWAEEGGAVRLGFKS